MKKILLLFLVCFILLYVSLMFRGYKENIIDNTLVINDGYVVANQNDIIKAIYNGLNTGIDAITMVCNYSDYNDCIDDFYTVYDNSNLMKSISDYIDPYNKYSLMIYHININGNHAKIVLNIDKKYTKEQIIEIDNIIDSYIEDLDLNNMTTEEKVKWAHDFIVNWVEYDIDSLEKREGNGFSAYDAIINNKAVCLGYAEAMAIILNKFNIPNIMISNDIHIWNMVYLNNSWLHIDTTWDDSLNSDDIKYDYYLITSEVLASIDSSDNHKYNFNDYEFLLN